MPPKNGERTYTSVSAHLSNTTAKRRGLAEQLLGELREGTERNDADIIGGDFNMLANREHGKNEDVMARVVVDSFAGCGSDAGPDGGLRTLLRLHHNEEERYELACSRAWNLPTQ